MPREFLAEFINLYRFNECVENKEQILFGQIEHFNVLIEKMKEIEPEANNDMIVKKIIL